MQRLSRHRRSACAWIVNPPACGGRGRVEISTFMPHRKARRLWIFHTIRLRVSAAPSPDRRSPKLCRGISCVAEDLLREPRADWPCGAVAGQAIIGAAVSALAASIRHSLCRLLSFLSPGERSFSRFAFSSLFSSTRRGATIAECRRDASLKWLNSTCAMAPESCQQVDCDCWKRTND